MSRGLINMTLAIAKPSRKNLARAWAYLKVECIPPLSGTFFHGQGGKAMEASISKLVDSFISGLETNIKNMDEAAAAAIKAKEEALLLAQQQANLAAKEKERVAQEAKKKVQEAEKKKTEEKAKADEIKAQDKAKAEAKKASDSKDKKNKPPPKENKKK